MKQFECCVKTSFKNFRRMMSWPKKNCLSCIPPGQVNLKNENVARIGELIDFVKCGIVLEKRPHLSFEIFKNYVQQEIQGFIISREHPEKVKKRHQLSSVTILWLSRSGAEYSISPDNILSLEDTVEDFLRENKRSVILLDGVEYLVLQRGLDLTLRFLLDLRSLLTTHDSRLIIPLHSDALSAEDYMALKREFAVFQTSDESFS